MRKGQAIDGKVREVSIIIGKLERKIAEEEMNYRDADSIKDKILNLRRKLGIFREVLKVYSSSPFNNSNMC